MTPKKYETAEERSRHYGTLKAGSEPGQSHTQHNTYFRSPEKRGRFADTAEETSYLKGKLPGGGSVDEHNPY
jgi:hypothetical protein